MIKLFAILFFYGFCSFSAHGQQDSTKVRYDTSPVAVKKISEDDLRAYRNDPKFNYKIEKVENTWWEHFKNWCYTLLRRFFEWLFGAEKALGFLGAFLRIIPYVLLGILIFLLIKFFLKVNARSLAYSKKNENLVSLSEEEHLIKNEDLHKLIQEALKHKNYRLAIRYYYLLILKLLSERELIVWELQKTNDDYIQELRTSELAVPFNAITRLYDYIWYGSFSIDEPRYLKAEKVFSSLQKTIDKSA